MNKSNQSLCRFAVMTVLTFSIAANALAAPRTNPANTTKSTQGWCVEDICLGQPESVLKPFASSGLPPISGAACADGTHRYVIARTDGVLEVTVDGTGKVVELARGYSDQVSPAQFDKMAKETARKLAAKTVARDAQGDATSLLLRHDAAKANAELRFTPKKPVALTVKLAQDSSPGACLAKAVPSK